MQAHPEVTVGFSDHYIIDGDGQINWEETKYFEVLFHRNEISEGIHRPFYRIALDFDAILPVSIAVYRRAIFVDATFPLEIESVYDRWFAYLACREGAGVYYIPEKLASYRCHLGADRVAINNQIEKSLWFSLGMTHYYSQLLADKKVSEVWPTLRNRVNISQTNAGILQLEEGNIHEARRNLKEALCHRKALRSYAALCLSYLPKPLIPPLVRFARRAV
ncbi:MAG TPA: hypothetical protein VKV29_01400 [Chthonomonas sp.]|uniref:hypothetical protein n=1 Tax=Chthonomonas sp. TaxID=2282153 RepID=UPI002B4B7B77|nr:hypothetical protein [Chthonomonas sp.]HLH78918.1 hypothetical protein [Chthonomonas sp.]